MLIPVGCDRLGPIACLSPWLAFTIADPDAAFFTVILFRYVLILQFLLFTFF